MLNDVKRARGLAHAYRSIDVDTLLRGSHVINKQQYPPKFLKKIDGKSQSRQEGSASKNETAV